MVPVLVPPELENTTIAPPVVTLFPAASLPRRCRVTTAPDVTVPFEIVTGDADGEIAPGDTVIVGALLVTGAPLIVAPIVVAVPASTPVNTAVYTPLPLSAVALIVPVLVPLERVNTTTAPPVVMSVPPASFAWSRSLTVLPESTEPLATVRSDVAGEITTPFAVALNAAAVTPGNAGRVAWKLCAPGVGPRTPVTLARPARSLITVVSFGVPPESERNRTATPATGRLSAPRTSTSSWVGSGRLTGPV